MSQKRFYEFGPYRLDVALSHLERSGQIVPLGPKAFDLLVLLARNADRIVSKTELLETLWPSTFVEESNLTQQVYLLRKMLGDRSGGHPYIELVPRRGYRLAVDVREVGRDETRSSDPRTALPAPVRSRRDAAMHEEGERKRATVLHCTIANAGAIAERLGAYGMHELTRQIVELARCDIGEFEGVISARHPDGFICRVRRASRARG